MGTKNSFRNIAIGSGFPSIIGHTARTTDPVIRETGTFKEKLKSTFPGLSKSLPAKHTFFGEEKKKNKRISI